MELCLPRALNTHRFSRISKYQQIERRAEILTPGYHVALTTVATVDESFTARVVNACDSRERVLNHSRIVPAGACTAITHTVYVYLGVSSSFRDIRSTHLQCVVTRDTQALLNPRTLFIDYRPRRY